MKRRRDVHFKNVLCICGCWYSSSRKAAHETTPRHQEFMRKMAADKKEFSELVEAQLRRS